MKAFDDIMEGLNQAIEYEKGNLQSVWKRIIKVSPLPRYEADDIKRIRNTLKLSQSVFASIIGVSVKTVEAWESGRNIPEGPAQRMLQLIEKNPKMLEQYFTANPN
jgi:putative transcriptional regulator